MMLSDRRPHKAVAVLGDVMIDRYVTGKVERISPEAPVPVLLHSHDRAVAGGAANVAVNIVALGCNVQLVGSSGTIRTPKTSGASWRRPACRLISWLTAPGRRSA